MQMMLSEDFTSAPPVCAFCGKSSSLKHFNGAFTVCSQGFAQLLKNEVWI